MSTITKEVFIPKSHKLNLEIDLPPEIPTGEAVVVLTVQTKAVAQKRVNRMAELEGKYQGQIWMAEDFDAPMDEFTEYM